MNGRKTGIQVRKEKFNAEFSVGDRMMITDPETGKEYYGLVSDRSGDINQRDYTLGENDSTIGCFVEYEHKDVFPIFAWDNVIKMYSTCKGCGNPYQMCC